MNGARQPIPVGPRGNGRERSAQRVGGHTKQQWQNEARGPQGSQGALEKGMVAIGWVVGGLDKAMQVWHVKQVPAQVQSRQQGQFADGSRQSSVEGAPGRAQGPASQHKEGHKTLPG